ncbi:GyrI-like domain-containing protein [Bacteroidota bacterium]
MDNNWEDYSDFRKDQLQKEYLARINKVIDYIEEHIGEPMNLSQLADVASFSRFHFHRLFSAITGETLNDFIKRIKLEKAASRIIDDPRVSITELAIILGFSSHSVFTRSFSQYFGISPSSLRDLKFKFKNDPDNIITNIDKYISNTSKGDSNIRKALCKTTSYLSNIQKQNTKNIIMDVQIKDLPEMHVAYCRHIGPYNEVGKAFDRLMNWAGPRGLLNFPETQMLAVYHDDPAITDEKKLRSSACITVPSKTKVDGEVGKMDLKPGKFTLARFELKDNEYAEAWNNVMNWFPESGYQPADGQYFEWYHNNPEDHPEKKCIVDICVPVKPM